MTVLELIDKLHRIIRDQPSFETAQVVLLTRFHDSKKGTVTIDRKVNSVKKRINHQYSVTIEA